MGVVTGSLDRIPLMMSHESAALIGGLRQAVDDMIVRLATDPTQTMDLPPSDSAIIQTVASLVSLKSAPSDGPQTSPRG